MKLRGVILILLTFLLECVVAQGYQPDVLGEGFEQHTFDMGCDYGGEVFSTLVRALPVVEGRASVLYVHGYSDYFFQRDMAQRFVDSAYNFYALDLRRYGRSIREHHTPYDVRDLSEYFDDIDSALVVMRREGAREIILVSHSTGGLITSLYCMQPEVERQPVDAMVLNSPFLDMNMGWAVEEVVIPVVSLFGGVFAGGEISQGGASLYGESLHRDYRGEWDFNLDWKPINSRPLTLAWLRAIHRGNRAVQRAGRAIDIPILLMYSDKSVVAREWSEAITSADAVLDVSDIKRYGADLGTDVTHLEVVDGIHDLVLSRPEVREGVYHAIFDWLRGLDL
ncbi:MAG: alpha/beta hydrolase [Rikenellaceae bacterium]